MAKEALKPNNPTVTVLLSRMEKYSRSSLQENRKDNRTGRHFYNAQNSIRQSKIIHNLSREDHFNKNKDGSYKTLFYTSYKKNTVHYALFV